MKKTALLVFIAGIVLSDVMGQSVTPNYVETTIFQGAGNEQTAIKSREYTDGLNRVLQTGIKRFSGTSENNALIMAAVYDDAGRTTVKLKPFPSTNGLEYQSDLSGKLSTYAYSSIEYYKDPLGTYKEIGAPGETFAIGKDHSILLWYFGTAAGEADNPIVDGSGLIKPAWFLSSTNRAEMFSNLTTLPSNLMQDIKEPDLFLTVSMDQNDSITQELKDLTGNTVKKWVCTESFTRPIITLS
jgi:hypothetical protein